MKGKTFMKGEISVKGKTSMKGEDFMKGETFVKGEKRTNRQFILKLLRGKKNPRSQNQKA